MDTVYGRRSADISRRIVRGTKRPTKQAEGQGDRRRLTQLMVSLMLFLLVYIGRGVFPAQFKLWQDAVYQNVDFSAAFQEFSRAISDGSPLGESLEALCVRILGGEPGQDEPLLIAGMPTKVLLLSETPGAGRAYLNTHGVMIKTESGEKAENPGILVSQTPEPFATIEPTQLVLETAIAQEYSEDGIKLPSNVSLAFYELGLPKTVDPVEGRITSGFGFRDNPISENHEFHLALDIGAAEGTEIGAFADGVVEYIGESDIFGQYLKITHANNVSSFYAHCSRLLVSKGDAVTCGQTVALVGHTGNATGPHLHLTIEKDNIRLNPAYYVDLS